MSSLNKVFALLTRKERKRALLLLGMVFFMALIDAVGVASIMPFIAVLANPELVKTNEILYTIYSYLEIHNTQSFLFYLGVFVFILLIVSLTFKSITTYLQLRFTLNTEYNLSKKLVEGYLRQPYSWFLNHHSADLGKTVLSEVSDVINYGMMPLMTLITQGILAVSLLALLMVVDPMVSMIAGITLGVIYGLIYMLINNFLSRIGAERVVANKARFMVLNEAFGAIKEVKIRNLENVYTERFSNPAKTYAANQASVQVIAQLPRFVLEMIAFGGMILLVLALMTRNGDFSTAIPLIALYAFSGYRLMPALQQVYASYSQLRFSSPSIDLVHRELTSLTTPPLPEAETNSMLPITDIELANVSYKYPKSDRTALNNINIRVPSNSIVGLVGTTGGGKTTTIDIILGLLEPQEGSLNVNGKAVTSNNRHTWQRNIGYVPQQIYLADDTINANIAFGIPPEQVDHAKVKRAAKIANLHHFVIEELPEGYSTHIGEGGVRLSGGQRQRIGIARALYHNPKVLILDEATSALDNLTEQAVMEAVNNLGHEIIIILIAHRLSTVRNCDQIYLMDDGQIKAHGTYNDLIRSSNIFRSMVSK